jgi:hypothetical protein
MGVQEGTVSIDGYQVWYRRADSGGIPMLLPQDPVPSRANASIR